MPLQETGSWWMGTVPRTWFPHRDACLAAPLTAPAKRLVTLLALVPREHAGPHRASRPWLGRPRKARAVLARALVANAGVGEPPPRALRPAGRPTATRRTRGGCATRHAVPSAATCSRALAAGALGGLAPVVQEARGHAPGRTVLLGPRSRDAPARQGRAQPVTPVQHPTGPRQQGRPAQGGPQAPPAPTRLAVQRPPAAPEALALLPPAGDRGVTHNATGSPDTGNGLPRPSDVNARGRPGRARGTSASGPASPVAIPLRTLRRTQVPSGSARLAATSDAGPLGEPRRARGPGPLMDRPPRGGPWSLWPPRRRSVTTSAPPQSGATVAGRTPAAVAT
jgi:hypothetical protein